MSNSSQVLFFSLEAYYDTGSLKWLYFLIIMFAYILIALSNLLLITLICLNRILHKPMYFFLCSLFMNELWGSTGLLPFLMLQILQDEHTISVPFCFVQIFFLFSYSHIELLSLAVISYDRYLAICFPLQYHANRTNTKVFILIALTWILLFVAVFILVSLSAPLKLCGNVINRLFCDNYSVMRLSCSSISVNNIYGIVHLCFVISVPVSVILFTYIHILKVCFRGSKQTQQKAMSTCVPHLVSIINFAFGVSFEVLHSRVEITSLPINVKIFMSVYFLTVPPLLNPVMYGLQMSAIRTSCKIIKIKG